MDCPFCGAADTKVVDSRLVAEGTQVRRRRRCQVCGDRVTTYELPELSYPRVIKQGGSRQTFSVEKIRSGMYKALEKRPVSMEAVEDEVTRIIHEVRVNGEREIASQWIGEKVMHALKILDPIAYVRFASVYRSFQDLDAFRETIDHLQNKEEKIS